MRWDRGLFDDIDEEIMKARFTENVLVLTLETAEESEEYAAWKANRERGLLIWDESGDMPLIDGCRLEDVG